MATRHNLISIQWLVALILFVGCSGGSQQQGQQGEQVNGQQEQQQLENPSLNGNVKNTAQGEALNNAAPPTGANNFSGANPTNGATMNNALLDNPYGANPNTGNPTAVPLNQSTPLNTGNATALGNSAAPPTNVVAPTNAAAAPAATPSSTDRMNASPFTNPQMNWPGKGKVKYVTRQATRHSSPNGPVVGEMTTGDHPLIYQNGNWVELHDGTFIKGNSMTDTPTGYERRASH